MVVECPCVAGASLGPYLHVLHLLTPTSVTHAKRGTWAHERLEEPDPIATCHRKLSAPEGRYPHAAPSGAGHFNCDMR